MIWQRWDASIQVLRKMYIALDVKIEDIVNVVPERCE